jgi:UDP-glucose 4-epimerase
MEHILKWVDQADGIKAIALRYFFVAGAKADGSIGEDHDPETHLVPNVLKAAIGKIPQIVMFGDDYDTPDGFNVRDYVHVVDLVDAHLLALNYLNQNNRSDYFNLGSANGFSVKQMVEAAKQATRVDIPSKIGPRRPGDPDSLIADSTKARRLLGWQPQYESTVDMIATAWNFMQKHPNGYGDK